MVQALGEMADLRQIVGFLLRHVYDSLVVNLGHSSRTRLSVAEKSLYTGFREFSLVSNQAFEGLLGSQKCVPPLLIKRKVILWILVEDLTVRLPSG